MDLSASGDYVYNTASSKIGKGQYTAMTGTSFSAPMVAGAAALMLSLKDRRLTAAQLKETLMQSVDMSDVLAGTSVSEVRGRVHLYVLLLLCWSKYLRAEMPLHALFGMGVVSCYPRGAVGGTSRLCRALRVLGVALAACVWRGIKAPLGSLFCRLTPLCSATWLRRVS